MLKALTFVVSAENHSDLLARAVLLVHRLAVPTYGFTMKRPKDSPSMRMTIEVLAEPEQVDRIAANLSKLVHVVAI
jgi:acetolactate synthase small subunit